MKLYDCTIVGEVFFDFVVQKKSSENDFSVGGTSYLDYAKLAPGGSGNIAAGTSLLGLKIAFIGKAGKDMLGKIYKEDLKSLGVKTKIFFDKSLPTGALIALTESTGERSFQVFRGANDELKPEEIESSEKLIANSRYLYVNGFSLVSSQQQNSILKAVDIAHQNKVEIVFDPGAYNLIESKRELFQNLLSSCDIFCPNLREATAITNTNTLEAAVERLRNSVKFAAIKLGEKGSIIVRGNETSKALPVKVDVVDTTGAGDAFTAAIIYGLVKNLPLNLTSRIANWYAAQVTRFFGSRCYPSKNEIVAFIKGLKNSDRNHARFSINIPEIKKKILT